MRPGFRGVSAVEPIFQRMKEASSQAIWNTKRRGFSRRLLERRDSNHVVSEALIDELSSCVTPDNVRHFDALVAGTGTRLAERMHLIVMLDKLDVRVSAGTPLQPLVAEMLDDRIRGTWSRTITSSLHYHHVIDLRPFGIDALLHFGFKHDRNRAHKLELLNTGEKVFDQMLDQIGLVFDVDPYSLDVMRTDLAADIDGIPVSWFRRYTRVLHKRFSRQIGRMTVEFSEAGKREIETLYFGKIPNCIRVYNRTAEQTARYLKKYAAVVRPYLGRGLNISEILGFDGLEVTSGNGAGTPIMVPSFKDLYGISPDSIRTRIERQLGGGRIPPELNQVWKLKKNLAQFNPFEPVRFLDAPLSPNLCALTGRDYLMVLGLQTLIDEYGHQRARQELNARSKRNAARFFDKYGEFVQVDPADGPGISGAELFEKYRASICRQLA